jgi:hypothetical protein
LIKWLIALKGRPINEEALDAVEEEEVVAAIEEIEALREEEEVAVVEAGELLDPREEERRTTLAAGCLLPSSAAS